MSSYNLIARHPALVILREGIEFIQTYTERDSPDIALTQCLKEFPLAQGFTGHYVIDTVLGVVTTRVLALDLDDGDWLTEESLHNLKEEIGALGL